MEQVVMYPSLKEWAKLWTQKSKGHVLTLSYSDTF